MVWALSSRSAVDSIRMMLGKPLSALCSCSQFVRYFHQYFPLGIYCNVLGEATIPFCSYSSSPRESKCWEKKKKNSVLSALQERVLVEKSEIIGCLFLPHISLWCTGESLEPQWGMCLCRMLNGFVIIIQWKPHATSCQKRCFVLCCRTREAALTICEPAGAVCLFGNSCIGNSGLPLVYI